MQFYSDQSRPRSISRPALNGDLQQTEKATLISERGLYFMPPSHTLSRFDTPHATL
jgi:hypothetical protein